MDIQVKFFQAAKEMAKSFVVDTSKLVAGGRRNYFASKEEAQAFADHLKKELTPNLQEAWDWDFQTLRDRFVQHLEQQYQDEEISRSSLIEKRRHSKTFVALSLADKPLANVKVRDLTTGQIRLQLMNELKQGRSIKTVKNILGNVRVMFDYALDCGCRNSNPALGVKAKGTKKTGINRAKRIQPEIIDAVIAAMPEQWHCAHGSQQRLAYDRASSARLHGGTLTWKTTLFVSSRPSNIVAKSVRQKPTKVIARCR